MMLSALRLHFWFGTLYLVLDCVLHNVALCVLKCVRSELSVICSIIISMLCCRSNTNVTPGDVVQVNASFDVNNGCYVVGNAAEDSSIVVDPDTLISVTSVANSITCPRK